MIRMIQSRSAGHAKAYFTNALSKADYYTSDQELPGFWQGRLAARLGISGHTSKEAFFDLCDNLHPGTGKPLTPRTREERTTGYDINFHCPKSVSILHVFAKDDHILTAFQDSVTATMQSIEADAKTRIRKNGVYDDRTTGELIWGHFTHQTARPVEGLSPDPHLHSHCFVLNATWDEQEQRIKAGQFKDINRDMPFYQAQFHKHLSDRLIALGYQVNRTDKSFEIVGVPKRVIDLFSKRTDEIGRIAKEKGITDAKELAELGARTRAKKQKGTSMDELKKEWRGQIEKLGAGDAGEGERTVRFGKAKDLPELTAQQCLDHAVLHCFERASVVPNRKLLETAFRHGIGHSSVTATAIEKLFATDSRLIPIKQKSRNLCTTKDVLSEEKRMVELARAGQGKLVPLYKVAPALSLDGQQANAITHVLTTPHRVSIIRGAAGTGKTTLMREAVKHFNATSKEVFVVAPTAQASRGVLRKEGFKDAETVAMFLTDKTMQEKIKGQVLWVDEAGLLGTKDMLALLEVATAQNARLILGGDTRQHASVVRGDALRVINTVGGIQSAEVDKIFRQRGKEYREAVEDLSKGDVPAAFKKLDDLDFIKAIESDNASDALVNGYFDTITRGKSALIISPTHAQGEALTQAIRERMKNDRLLGKREISARRLVSLNLTEAEKADHRNFREGHIVQFTQNAPGFMRGSLWEVTSADEKEILVRNEKGNVKALPKDKGDRYDVFRETGINLSKGDLIRITKNGFDAGNKRLDNGDMLIVTKVSKDGTIMLENQQGNSTYELKSDFGHLAHAYCITSHASQGKTVDEVFIWQPSSTFPATDAKQFYVSVSRGREQTHIFTDSKEDLLQHANDLGLRLSALEAVSTSKVRKDFLRQQQKPEPQPPKNDKHISKPKERDYGPNI